MKVIFLYPEYYEIARFGRKRKEYPPFGVMYLAAIVEEKNYSVEIRSVSTENYKFDLREYDLVLYSLSSSCTYEMMKKSRRESLFNFSAKIFVGGIHASLYPHEVFKDFNANYLIKGEGEIALGEILNSLERGEDDVSIRGVMTKNNSEEPIEYANYIENLDEIPYPARHLLPEEDFIMTGRLAIRNIRMTHILVSRGCPYNCYFCGGLNKNYRYRSAEKVYEELIYLKNTYGIGGFVINDENFTVNKKIVIEICNKLEGLQMPWSALSRVDTIDGEMINALAKAHCIELKFGLESGSDSMLKVMNKRCTTQDATKALDLCYKNKINAKLFIMHGFPGENENTTSETIDFLNQNKQKIDRISLFRWTPLPGSYVYENAQKYELKKEKLTFENAIIYSKDNNWFQDNEYNKMLDQEYRRLEAFIEKNINTK